MKHNDFLRLKLSITESATVFRVHVSLIGEFSTCAELPAGRRGCDIKNEPSKTEYSWWQSFTCQSPLWEAIFFWGNDASFGLPK